MAVATVPSKGAGALPSRMATKQMEATKSVASPRPPIVLKIPATPVAPRVILVWMVTVEAEEQEQRMAMAAKLVQIHTTMERERQVEKAEMA